jgi:signal transduction histidine kinase
VAALAALRRSPSPRWTRVVAFATVNATYVLMAAGDVLKDHLDTTPLLAAVCSMTAAALLPWGVRPQAGTAALVGVGNLVALALTGRPLNELVDPAASVTATLCVSVYVAYEFERYRRQHEGIEATLAERARLEGLRADVRGGALDQPSLRESLQFCAEAVVRHLPAAFARIWTLSADGTTLELQASAGMYTHIDGAHARVPVGHLKIGLIAHERRPHLTNAVLDDPRIGDPAWARREGMVAFAGYPLVIDDKLLGVVAMFARQKLAGATLTGLASVADAIALVVDRLRVEEARSQVVAELERANQLKSEFVSTMSHELRTPINVIVGYLDMLEDVDVAQDDKSIAFGRIRHANRELLELVEATLDVNRLESGRDEPEIGPVRLDGLWNELEMEFTGVRRDPELQLSWLPVNGVVVHTDRRKLKTIMKNLVGNALKFSPRGEVVVSCGADERDCWFTVRDTGIGIAPEHLPFIFEMFRQIDSSDRRKYGGVGLGLHIVRCLCQQLGGSVEVESELGRGSTFTVKLPLLASAGNPP